MACLCRMSLVRLGEVVLQGHLQRRFCDDGMRHAILGTGAAFALRIEEDL
jgi:hypothetical protein